MRPLVLWLALEKVKTFGNNNTNKNLIDRYVRKTDNVPIESLDCMVLYKLIYLCTERCLTVTYIFFNAIEDGNSGLGY